MKSVEVRQKFFDYFIEQGHTQVPSSSLIPAQDPTLLFANAGMNQFKDLFLGKETRSYKRAVSIQKCIRAGGKHNDLENVGFTKRHLTFFEMMGNFSFGDYFKKEAIAYAWEFLTTVIGLDKDKLHASVYKKDDEAYLIWQKDIGLPTERIWRLGEADNFWQMGDTGPCGPCSEIYIDRGDGTGCGSKDCSPGCSCDRFLEIWNLVFMQFDRQPDGTDVPLKQTGVDTGMGLERLCTIVQQVESVYETDLFMPLLVSIETLTGKTYAQSTPDIKGAFRVLVDHIRSTSFAIADGCIPSNEGRGYVLRKIIRRAALFQQKLTPKNIFPELSRSLVTLMGSLYPELKTQEKTIFTILTSETGKFAANLINGQAILQSYFAESKDKTISGFQAFKLYDTYGFPLELTKVIASERNFSVDTDGFNEYMEQQRLQSGKKIAAPTCTLEQDITTQFTGYEEHITQAVIETLIVDSKEVSGVPAGTICAVITDKSPFYVECGGQISDQGIIKIGAHEARLLEVKKIGNAIAAFIQAPTAIKKGDSVTLIVDSPSRINTMKNHTATHILQAALISVLGNQVKQSGSLVTPEYLRFDFSYPESVTQEQIVHIEELVNQKIMQNIPLRITQSTLKEATARGVIAFFGEKYNPEKVRVVEIPGFSAELCGGTHVNATGDIGSFKISELSALSAGTKRIVALTGPGALQLFQDTFAAVKTLSQQFKVPFEQVTQAIDKQQAQIQQNQVAFKELKKSLYTQLIKTLNPIDLKGLPVVYAHLPYAQPTDLKEVSTLIQKQYPGLVFAVSTEGDKTYFFSNISAEYSSRLDMLKLSSWLKEHGLQGSAKATLMQGGGSKITGNFDQLFFAELKKLILG